MNFNFLLLLLIRTVVFMKTDAFLTSPNSLDEDMKGAKCLNPGVMNSSFRTYEWRAHLLFDGSAKFGRRIAS